MKIQELLIERIWKVVVRNGKVTALKIEKDQYGRKSVGAGYDGSEQGKKDIRMLMSSDVKTGRIWSEVSGKSDSLYIKMGATPIEAKYAEVLVKHPILSINPDGYHYTRLFNGIPREKVIIGFADISLDELNELEKNHTNIHKLPNNIRIKKG